MKFNVLLLLLLLVLLLFDCCCCCNSILSFSSISSIISSLSESSSSSSSSSSSELSSSSSSFSNTTSSTMNYNTILRKLYQINTMNPVKMGLSNTHALYELIGRPLDSLPIIHVAGTNGKGSVALKTATCLQQCGIKTGLFVSPHISSFRERSQTNGICMTEDEVIDILPMIFDLCKKHDIPATFFEITTIMAFEKIKRDRCEAAVLEVGLGGRLDSTNIITPTLSIITSIQLDHTKILGDTIELIAMEKAGIMKPGVDVLVGPGCPIDLLRQEAKRVGSPFYTIHDILKPEELLYNNNKENDIDDLNTDISRAAIRILKNKKGVLSLLNNDKAEDGLAIRPPCRFEIFNQKINLYDGIVDVPVIFDIAHNDDAIIALVKKINYKYSGKSIRLVFGMSADKDIEKCLKSLLALTSSNKIHCVAARHPRAISPKDLRLMINNLLPNKENNSFNDGNVREAVRQAINEAANENGIVVVCGTAFIMAEARYEMGIREPKDGDLLSNDAQEFFSAK